MHTSFLKGAVCNIEMFTPVSLQIQDIGESCFLHPILIRFHAHTGCQIEVMQQEQWKTVSWSANIYVCNVFFYCWGILVLVQVESANFWPSSFADLATHYVEILLGKLPVSRTTQIKTKTDIPTKNTHLKVESLKHSCFLFLRNKYKVIVCFSTDIFTRSF